MTHAYVTMICGGDAYVPGIEALGRSLVETQTSAPRVVMVTPEVPTEATSKLAAQGWEIREVAPIPNPHRDDELLFRRFGASFTKLRAFDLCEYERIVFLDADTIVLRNIDDLFQRPGFAAAPDFFMPDRFNSGVMVVEPSHALFERLQAALSTSPSYDGGDQGFLNSFWPDWWSMPVAHRLTSGYNMHHFVFQFMMGHPSLRAQCLADIRVLHYTLQKPWMQFTVMGGAKHWWDKYYEVHPERDDAWHRRLHELQDWTFERVVALLGA